MGNKIKTKDLFLIIGIIAALWAIFLAPFTILTIFGLLHYKGGAGSGLGIVFSWFFSYILGLFVLLIVFVGVNPLKLIWSGYFISSTLLIFGILFYCIPIVFFSIYIISGLLYRAPGLGIICVLGFSIHFAFVLLYLAHAFFMYSSSRKKTPPHFLIMLLVGAGITILSFFVIILNFERLNELFPFGVFVLLSFLGLALISLGLIEIIFKHFKYILRYFGLVISFGIFGVSFYMIAVDIHLWSNRFFTMILSVLFTLSLILQLILLAHALFGIKHLKQRKFQMIL